MREIEFRGQFIDTGEWVYGDLEQYEDMRFITNHNTFRSCLKVYPKTVGQFTTRKIGNKKIYEGDLIYITIFDCFGSDKQYLCRVEWWGSAFWLVSVKSEDDRWDLDWALSQDDEPEIRGNIHENPELVK